MTSPGTSFADPGGSSGGTESRDVEVRLGADVSGYTQQVGAAQQQTAALEGSVNKLGISFASLTKAAGKKLFQFAAADFAVLGAAVADATSLERQLATLQATSVVTGTSMTSMSKELDQAFASFPVSRQAVIQLAETINNLGVTAPKAVGSLTKTYIKQGAATGEDAQGLAAGGIQLGRQMGVTDPGELDKYANSLLVVSKSQGVAASGVNEFAAAIAPMSRAAGIGMAAVQGISAAFQKAGADGGYAANTFSKIVGEISELTQTGSPELAKYASFVGKTTAEFRNMSGTDQATSVFSQIGKGGPEALNFMSSIGLSQRDTRAVMSVAQSGDLKQSIAIAQGASTNTEKLNSASEAAFAGLADSLVSVKNQFTALGELIGGPLLTPLGLLVKAFGLMMGLVTGVVSALGPVAPALALLAGGLATLGTLLLGKMGTILTLGLGRTLLGPRSAGRVALGEGRLAGAAIRGGMSQEAAMAASAVGTRVAAGGAQLRDSVPYNYGMAAGQRAPGPLSKLGTVASRGVQGLGQVVMGTTGWLAADQGRMYRDSYAKTEFRSGAPGLAGKTPAEIYRAEIRAGAGLEGPLRASGEPIHASPVGPIRTTPTLRESIKTSGGGVRGVARSLRDMTGASIYAAGSMIASGTGGITRKAAEAAQNAAELKAGAKLQGPLPASGAPMRAPTVSPLATGLGAAAATGGVAAKVGGTVLAAAASHPLTAIAAMVAVPLIGSVVDAIKEGNAARADMSTALSGGSKYDEVLGKTSTNLSRFGDNVAAAADRLSKFANTPIKNLGTVSGEDINSVGSSDYKIADPKLRDVIEQATARQARPGADQNIVKEAVAAYLGSISTEGPVTGDRFTKLKQDVLSVMGTGQSGTVSQIMTAYAAQPGGTASTPQDYGKLASLAQTASNPQDRGDPANIERYKNIFGTGITGLQTGTQNSGEAGTKSRVAIALGMAAKGTSSADAGQLERIGATSTLLATATGADVGELSSGMNAASSDFGAGTEFKTGDTTISSPFGNEKDALSVWVRTYANSKEGKAFLERNKMTEADLFNAAQNPEALPPPSASDTAASLRKEGSLGKWAAGNTQFQAAATGAQSGKPVPGFEAAKQLTAEAVKQAGGDLPQAGANLMALADKIGGATGALIRSAAQWADYLQSLKLPTLSREGQLTAVTHDAAVANAALRPDSSQESKDAAFAKTQTADNQKESYRQYMISRIVQLKAFAVQQERAEEDQNTQVGRINRDFGLQQARAQEDYYKSRTRAQEDFGLQRVRGVQDYNLQVLRGQQDFQLQSIRSQQDYQLSVGRQNADHARDLRRQAAAAAQDIYDPFVRVQVKATTDAGTLIYNLTQQNTDIERQIQQIQDLKAQGLSQDTVDTLKLSDAGNAQQVNTLLKSLQQNPDMTGQINSLIGTRKTSTTTLTQSPDSMLFRQSEEDYAQAMSRASDDFSKAQQRAADDQSKTLSRMSDDFAKSQQRASEDQAKSMSRMSDDFSVSQSRAVADHAKALSDMAVDFRKTQDRAAADLATSLEQYTGTFAEVFSQLTGTALGSLGKYAPAAVAIINAELAKIKPITFNISSSSTPAKGQTTSGSTTSVRGTYAHGGISLTQQQAMVSEYGPELHLPLNSRGENFMAGLIAKSLAQGVTAATASVTPASTSSSSDNRISFAGADITVTASDPNAMARELAAKAKLGRLASPVRH